MLELARFKVSNLAAPDVQRLDTDQAKRAQMSDASHEGGVHA